MKRNRKTKFEPKPKGWIYGARWSGIPVDARVCKITVGAAPDNWWCRDIVGQERSAIEVKFIEQTVYIDNDNGWALEVFLKGLAPLPRFRFVPVFFVADDDTAQQCYHAKHADTI